MQFGSQNILWFSKPENSFLQFCAKEGEMKVKDKMSFLVWEGLAKHPGPAVEGRKKEEYIGKCWQLMLIFQQKG